MPRSRILRVDKNESKLVENIISATIDAGFVGKLVFKTKLTEFGATNLSDFQTFQKIIQNSVQIDLIPFSNNYYGFGHDNYKENLTPNVVFCGEHYKENLENNLDSLNNSSNQNLLQIYNNLPKSYQNILLNLAQTMTKQSEKGKIKYGTNIDENLNSNPEYWQNHLLEELADGLVYLQKFIDSKNV